MKKYLIAICVTVLALSFAGSVTAQTKSTDAKEDPCWSDFYTLGSGVSVSFCEVNKRNHSGSDWTWRFRNDESTTITLLEFTYTEQSFLVIEKKHDVFPGDLKPGRSFGGWAAFLATSDSRPMITIDKIKRATPLPSLAGRWVGPEWQGTTERQGMTVVQSGKSLKMYQPTGEFMFQGTLEGNELITSATRQPTELTANDVSSCGLSSNILYANVSIKATFSEDGKSVHMEQITEKVTVGNCVFGGTIDLGTWYKK
jgi:hypothetical protein